MTQLPADSLLASIAAETDLSLDPSTWIPVGGGDINSAARCADQRGRLWFIKINSADLIDMFTAEAEGLGQLAEVDQLRTPSVAGYGNNGMQSWLVLEWLDIVAAAEEKSLAAAVARMHSLTSETYGWRRDNFIGSTPQHNTESTDWQEFFRDRRLRYQLRLAESNAAPESLLSAGNELLDQLDKFFRDHNPVASLLHGDLWSGNKGSLADGRPVLFDPAVYFGDREADLAMTRLFGGFGSAFYSAYESEWPLDSGAAERQELYNLYHVLNHFNLFGGAYLGKAESLISHLLRL